MGMSWIPYPYCPRQTTERVIMDNMSGITHVIRGDDFGTEYSFYCLRCQEFSLFTPEFIFLPRLESLYGDISKTNGGYKIADFRRDGYTAKQLKDMMMKACLIYPNNDWELYNLKRAPRLDI
jgi:glutamyl/glutaminyl-tRNA synthetase